MSQKFDRVGHNDSIKRIFCQNPKVIIIDISIFDDSVQIHNHFLSKSWVFIHELLIQSNTHMTCGLDTIWQIRVFGSSQFQDGNVVFQVVGIVTLLNLGSAQEGGKSKQRNAITCNQPTYYSPQHNTTNNRTHALTFSMASSSISVLTSAFSLPQYSKTFILLSCSSSSVTVVGTTGC